MATRNDRAERNDRALLQAARAVLAEDGAHASVATIAARAGVGIGSLYRRYRTKEELFQRLSVLSLEHWIEAAEQGLADPDPWAGLAGFIKDSVEFGQGTMAPIAGAIEVTDEMSAKSRRGDDLLDALVRRAHGAGTLRPDVTVTDISLMIEQLGRSPLVDQLRKQGRDDLLPAATQARARLITIALDGLRSGSPGRLPGDPPGEELFTARWAPA
ncbi:helix-turn-helix domain-containing protein [Streptosporangium sp. NPDC006013]|uniref:TetR/AcrR family transcriptional regulator n=1 Tax=Streptosporangium sp. NPDC006013 TaxID=3155596 RepID=UPI0033A6E5D4